MKILKPLPVVLLLAGVAAQALAGAPQDLYYDGLQCRSVHAAALQAVVVEVLRRAGERLRGDAGEQQDNRQWLEDLHERESGNARSGLLRHRAFRTVGRSAGRTMRREAAAGRFRAPGAP